MVHPTTQGFKIKGAKMWDLRKCAASRNISQISKWRTVFGAAPVTRGPVMLAKVQKFLLTHHLLNPWFEASSVHAESPHKI